MFPPPAFTLSCLVLAAKVWLKWKCPSPADATRSNPRYPVRARQTGTPITRATRRAGVSGSAALPWPGRGGGVPCVPAW